MLLGIGPWAAGMRLLTSGALDAYNERTSTAFFEAAAHAVAYDRFLVWPAVLCLASFLSVRFVRPSAWWHGLVVSLATLPDIFSTQYPFSEISYCVGCAAFTAGLFVLFARLRQWRLASAAAT
jgi:hypothetical protein